MLSHVTARIAFTLALLLVAVGGSFAQVGNQGTIQGTVVDQTGAVVPGAEIVATRTATAATFTTTTTSDGFFEFPILPVGTYDLQVKRSGFTTLTDKGVELHIGAKLNLKLELKLSGKEETVVVEGEAPLVETTRTQVSSSVNDLTVSNTPANGRNFIDFVLLTPGVNRDVRGGDLSFAGQRGTLNSLTVDGTDNNNTFFGQTLGRTGSGRAPYQFSQDSVQEFQVNTNGYSAELGRAGGAVINVITKSGTNQFHGTGFEFFRDRGLNATDPIAKAQGKAKQPYHFNQFGGNIGGPVLKDRLFFFFDYDGQRNITQNLVLPISGCATSSTDANITAACTYLLARSASWTSGFNQDVYLGKADWHINSNELLSVRINSQRFTGANLENGGSTNSLEHTGAAIVISDTISGQLTSTLSPRFVNEFRAAYVRDNEPGQANSANPEASVLNGGQAQLT